MNLESYLTNKNTELIHLFSRAVYTLPPAQFLFFFHFMTENDETNSEKLLDENDTWSNCDDWEEDSDANCLCPFCELKFPSATECFSHTIETHNFDFHLIKKTLKLDFYSCMRLVNYVRQNSELKMDEVIASFDEWKDVQKYLTPALPDDALLYGIYYLRSI